MPTLLELSVSGVVRRVCGRAYTETGITTQGPRYRSRPRFSNSSIKSRNRSGLSPAPKATDPEA